MSKEELHGTITARAELDRAFARLLVEDATEVMSKNLSSLLQVIERNHTEIKRLMEDNGARLGKVEGEIASILERLARLEARPNV